MKLKQFFLALTLLFLVPSLTLGATSGITITRQPFIFFANVPSSALLPDPSNPAETSISVPIVDTNIFSNPTVTGDPGTGEEFLPANKWLTVQDNRACGGFNLQATAESFTSGGETVPNTGFYLATTNAFPNTEIGTRLNGIFYYDQFLGNQTVTAPQDVTTPPNTGTADFSTASTFTGLTGNTLNGTVDLMLGSINVEAPIDPLTEGRDGQMAIGVAYYLNLPKYTLPGEYKSKVTYTILDATTGDPC